MATSNSDAHTVIRMTDQVDELSLQGVSKHYGAVVAVAEATVAFRRGEITGLVGENGAGKSTLISLVTGANRPDTGSFSVAGMPVHDFDPQRAREAGIFAIRQEPVLVPALSVTENLLLGMEPAQRGIYARRRASAMAEEWLDRVGAGFRPDVRVESLSPADRQLVEVARAVGPGAKSCSSTSPRRRWGPRRPSAYSTQTDQEDGQQTDDRSRRSTEDIREPTPLEHRHDDPEGRRDGEHEAECRRERHEDRAEREHEQEEGQTVCARRAPSW